MSIRKQRKKTNQVQSPDYKLAKGQFRRLNEEFYKNYLTDYYSVKVASLINLLNEKDFYAKRLKNNKINKLEFSLSPDSNESISKYAKTELVMTLFHCLETFIRLYIAHADLKGCPWLTLAKIDLKTFRKAVDSLKRNNFNFMNKKYSDDEIVSMVFLGTKVVPDELAQKMDLDKVTIIDRFKQYLKYSAEYVDNNSQYNTFKHGMYLSQRQTGITIKNSVGEVGKKGDAFVFITKKKDKDQNWKWYKNMHWIDTTQAATLIIFYNFYINCMLNLWNDLLVNSTKKEHHIQGPFDINEILKNRSGSGIFGHFTADAKIKDVEKWLDIKDISSQLLYYR